MRQRKVTEVLRELIQGCGQVLALGDPEPEEGYLHHDKKARFTVRF